MGNPSRLFLASILLFAVHVGADTTSDTQLWNVAQITHPVGERWVAGLWSSVRLDNDVSAYDSTLLRPSMQYEVSSRLRIGLGYNWSSRSGADEHRFFQDLAIGQQFGGLAIGHRARLEERWIDDRSGTIVRARYRIQGTHPLWRSRWSGVVSEEVLVNLNGLGEGPVSGFEQNRVSAGVRVRLGPHMRVQLGYTWRFKEARSGPDSNDHILGLNFFVTTRARQPRHAEPDEMQE